MVEVKGGGRGGDLVVDMYSPRVSSYQESINRHLKGE